MIVTLCSGSRVGQDLLDDRVPGLVVRGGQAVVLLDLAALAGPAEADLVAALLEVVLLDELLVLERRPDGGLVDDRRQLGAPRTWAWPWRASPN